MSWLPHKIKINSCKQLYGIHVSISGDEWRTITWTFKVSVSTRNETLVENRQKAGVLHGCGNSFFISQLFVYCNKTFQAYSAVIKHKTDCLRIGTIAGQAASKNKVPSPPYSLLAASLAPLNRVFVILTTFGKMREAKNLGPQAPKECRALPSNG